MTNWNDYAAQQADRARQNPQIERTVADTVIPILSEPLDITRIKQESGHGIHVIFGNDGYLQDPRVRHEVRILRRLLELKSIGALGFGIDSTDGRSWALVVRSDDQEKVYLMLEAAHKLAFHRGTILESLANAYLEQLYVSKEDLGPVLEEIEAPASTGPTDGNARITCVVTHQVSAQDEREAERQFKELAGAVQVQRIVVDEEDDGIFFVTATISFDCDLPGVVMLSDPPSNGELNDLYEAAKAEYARRYDFKEMEDLEVKVLTSEGAVLNVVDVLYERGESV